MFFLIQYVHHPLTVPFTDYVGYKTCCFICLLIKNKIEINKTKKSTVMGKMFSVTNFLKYYPEICASIGVPVSDSYEQMQIICLLIVHKKTNKKIFRLFQHFRHWICFIIYRNIQIWPGWNSWNAEWRMWRMSEYLSVLWLQTDP